MNRRIIIGGLGGLAALAGGSYLARNQITRMVLSSHRNEGVELTSADDFASCSLTPEQIEGPFFLSAPIRTDIREDREGIPFELTLQVLRADGCTPVAGAAVELWHCDAAGRYSGYREDLSRRPFDTLRYLGQPGGHVEHENAKTFLRGAQMSGADGQLAFTTILPGWYEPRATHFHLKVLLDGVAQVTTQLYFPDDLIRHVYTTHPIYLPHGEPVYTRDNDLVLDENPNATGLLLNPQESREGFRAGARLIIA